MAEIFTNLLGGFREIFVAPFRDPSIFWLLSPLLLFWFVLEIYFSKYKAEQLGWNSALGNGMTMMWVVVISLKALFTRGTDLFSLDKLLLIIFITLYSFFIIYISFTHKIQKGIFFFLASPTIVYFLSGVALVWVHGLIKIDMWVMISLIILYLMILLIEFILRKLMPEATSIGSGGNTESGGLGDLDSNLGGNQGGMMGGLGGGIGKI
jgi:predicted neutral ceramidase superfamily lipid hydrolase